MSVTAGVSDTIIAIRGKIGQAKVKRYWPGKAPEWGDDDAKEDGDIRMEAFSTGNDPGIACRKDDARLRRLAENRIDNRDEIRADHRRIRQAEIVSTIEEESGRQDGFEAEEDTAEALEERRRKIREKLLQRYEEEEEKEEESESESEYETDSEEDGTGFTTMVMKPVFVPKAERDTIVERDQLEAEERALEELAKRRLEERKLETKQLVVEEIRKDEEIQADNTADVVVDIDDEINEAEEEYEAWKVRETARINKRDREDPEAMLIEKEENRGKPCGQPKQKRRRFLQKYYHKGAFFQSEADAGSDDIYTRDFSAPTGEDRMDKTILPMVMQVKNFGRRGRTKWTHLVNEDTTDHWNHPYVSAPSFHAPDQSSSLRAMMFVS